MELRMAGTREENLGDPTTHYLPAPCHSSFVLQEMFHYHFIFKVIQLLNYNWLIFRIFIALSSSCTITLLSCPPWDLHNPPTLAEHFQLWPLLLLIHSPKISSFLALPLSPLLWIRSFFFFPSSTLRLSSDFPEESPALSIPFICPRWARSSKKLLWANRGKGSLEGCCYFWKVSFPLGIIYFFTRLYFLLQRFSQNKRFWAFMCPSITHGMEIIGVADLH